MLEYGGFWLEEERGNNRFAYNERGSNAKLWVPALKTAQGAQVMLGNLSVFAELDAEGKVQHFEGLQHFLFFEWNGVPIYIFDNHNHAFAFRYRELFKGTFQKGISLLHIDQHSDMHENPFSLLEETWESVVEFTNFSCNVGNFIQPALESGVVNSVEQIRTECKLLSFQKPDRNYLLDIDLDFWEEKMGISDSSSTIKKTKNLIASAKVVTISTSPYFLDQMKALSVLEKIFG